MVNVAFYGAAGEVTGSNHVVTTGINTYMVDCGLFQGGDLAPEHNAKSFAYNVADIKAVIITHAHLDHIGRLPKLVREGYRGPIYATEATIELTSLTLKDALDIMMHREEREHRQPMYEEVDLRRTLELFKPVRYHQAQPLHDGDQFTLFDAGHILGSSSVLLEAGGKKLVFSGDIGHWPNTLLPQPETPKNADAIIVEGTYGGVDREDRGNRLETIKWALEWAIQNRGVLLIPAFAVERSQELLYLLNHLFITKQLPKLPIYFDSPLAIEALEVFERHQELFNRDVQQERHNDTDVFNFKTLVLTPTGEDSREINEQAPPKVIIAGSGMMDGGRIHHHLRRYLPNKNTLLLIIGYQAHGTVGHQIVDGAKSVRIFGDDIPVNATIKIVDIFSGHADNKELVDWVKSISLPVEGGKVFVVHSDPARALEFQKEIVQIKPDAEVLVAKVEQTAEI